MSPPCVAGKALGKAEWTEQGTQAWGRASGPLLTAAPLVGRNPEACPAGLPPWPGAPTDLARATAPLVSGAPRLQFSRVPAPRLKDFQGTSPWAGRQMACRRGLLIRPGLAANKGRRPPSGGGLRQQLRWAERLDCAVTHSSGPPRSWPSSRPAHAGTACWKPPSASPNSREGRRACGGDPCPPRGPLEPRNPRRSVHQHPTSKST